MSGIEITDENRERFIEAYSAWRRLNLTEVNWTESKKTENGSLVLAYPIYPDEVFTVMRSAAGFRKNEEPYAQEVWDVDLAKASFFDAVSYYAWLYRAERFSDGTIAEAIKSGKFNQAAERILSFL